MDRMDLQCLFIGKQSRLYTDLVKALNESDVNLHIKLVDVKKNHVLLALKKLKGACLVFISDDVHFSLEELSDLIWQYASDAIVVVLTEDTTLKTSNYPLNNAQFFRMRFNKQSDETQIFLQYLLQIALLKSEFRHCKKLLGISEKRCQWLVDSSHESIAYISRDLHLHANSAFLGLLQFDSVQELRTIPVEDIIDEQEYILFNRLIESQSKHYDINRTLVLSMRKKNGEIFRANIRIIPSVYNGKKCSQLWVSAIDQLAIKSESLPATDIIQKDANKIKVIKTVETNQTVPNPFSILSERKIKKTEKVDPLSVIQEIIKRKDASLLAQKLTMTNKNKDADLQSHHLLSFVISDERRKEIDNLLFDPKLNQISREKALFWDRVKFSQLFDVLSKKTNIQATLLIRLSAESINNKIFTDWLLFEIDKLGVKVLHVVFLLPLASVEKQEKAFVSFSKKLVYYHCKVAIDDFVISKKALSSMLHLKPRYVRLSLEWVTRIKNDRKQKVILASYIKRIEVKGIRVIAPCGSSDEMRDYYVLSGVSFCQEK